MCRRRPAWVKDQSHPHGSLLVDKEALALTGKSKGKAKRKKDGKKNLDV